MNRVFPWFLLIAVAALVLRYPLVGLGLAGLVGIALVAHRLGGQEYRDPASDTDEPGPQNEVDPRTEQAMHLGGWEVGEYGKLQDGVIQGMATWGPFRIRVQYQEHIPYIVLQSLETQETEMVFILRRRQSPLDLPPIVSNTPIHSSSIEYQLRKMSLESSLEGHFEGATNRPRLFRQLLESGLASDVEALLTQNQYRLEDVVFNGRELLLIIHPAADPTQSPYVTDCRDMAQPIVERMIHFLETTPIPSARH